MVQLPRTVHAWDTPAFESTLRSELAALMPAGLPLGELTTHGGRLEESSVTLRLLQTEATANAICVRLGVLFTEWVGGCSCGDELMPVEGYGVIELSIDRRDATARFTPRPG